MIGHNTVTTRIGQDLELTKAPETVLVADCKGLGEANIDRSLVDPTDLLLVKIAVKWVNADRQP
eukprot:7117881-Lingulodinium_polyedra.AAC.1